KEEVKNYLLNRNIEVVDEGTYSLDSVDYPDFAVKVANDVVKENIFGILICTTGIGMSMAANKIKGVRAGLVTSVENAHLTREHNNANILCLGAKDVSCELATKIVDEFLTTEFAGLRRLFS
ncbi:MAG: RpiB/LacA/LacB family sugar-phosphate isomerase, partial [Streptococcus gallolyticus]|nr:RpiB/LacA/LacB family sugar-phosphate isomerase [Streptococcus gallolyticus]